MDVHRCRFVDYPSAAINALAFSHSSGVSSKGQPIRLAIGRENGNIEILDPRRGLWVYEKTLYGGRDRSVEGLAWIHDPDTHDPTTGFTTHGRLRLFSIGFSSSITEWDLHSGLPMRHSSGTHSEVWSMAAQPPIDPTSTQHLAAGCADGSVILLSTADDDLTFQKTIARPSKKSARALSIAWQSRSVLAVGFADSYIRIYEVTTGKVLREISLGSGPKDGPKDKLVWAIECLRDKTIVSGDSSGEVCFFDGTTYGQLRRIKGHEADTLCLASSKDGSMVFSGGMDRRTVIYKVDVIGRKRPKWSKLYHRRHHSHDVKAMACLENKNMSIMLSAGVDAVPSVVPVHQSTTEYHRRLPQTPQSSPIVGAKRFVVSWWDQQVTVWRVQPRKRPTKGSASDVEEDNFRLVTRIALKGQENIVTASISPDGRLLAVATVAETKLFCLRVDPSAFDSTIKVKKLQTSKSFGATGARLLQFSPDSEWLLKVEPDNQTRIACIKPEAEPNTLPSVSTFTTLKRNKTKSGSSQNCLNGQWGRYDRTISHVSFSGDSRIAAVADFSGAIDVWVLRNRSELKNSSGENAALRSDEESSSEADSEASADSIPDKASLQNHEWCLLPSDLNLPRLPGPPLVFSFRPSATQNLNRRPASSAINGMAATQSNETGDDSHDSEAQDKLLIVTADHELFEFETLKGRLSDWSRRNPASLLPDQFKLQRDRAIGCVWDVTTSGTTKRPRQRVWLYASTWMFMLDLDQDLESRDRKRKRVSEIEPSDSRDPREKLASKIKTSGAGSRIPDKELGGGIGSRSIRKLDSEGREEWIELQSGRRDASDIISQDSDDEESSSDGDGDRDDAADIAVDSNGKASSGEEAGVELPNGNTASKHTLPDGTARAAKAPIAVTTFKGSAFYMTLRYRPILGLVPLTEADDYNDEVQPDTIGSGEDRKKHASGQARRLEVALIERPVWDMELPPRFHGAQEWER